MLQFRICPITICLLLFAIDVFAQAAEKRSAGEDGFPEFVSGRVQMSWDDFKEVLDRLRLPDAKVEKEPTPPADWTLNSIAYTAEVTAEGRVRVDASMDLLVLNPDQWVTIPVLHENVAPVSLKLDGEATALTRDAEGWFALMLKGPGRHTFNASFYVTASESEGKAFFGFPTPRAPMTTMSLRIPTPDARVSAPAAEHLAATADEDSLLVDLAFKGTDNIRIEWASPATAEPEPEEIEPLVACSTATLAQISETFIGLVSNLQFSVLRGAVDSFRFSLPLDTNVFSIDGPEGLDWRRQELDDEQVIQVSLNHKVAEAYAFQVEYELPLAREAENFVIPELRILDVLRSNGNIAIAAQPNVELSPGVGMTNLSRTDKVELPPVLADLATTPIVLGFRYNSAGYTLPLEMIVSEPRVASTTETLVEFSDTHVYQTSNVRFDVLRGAVTSFRIALPVTTILLGIEGEGIVWSAQEDDEQQIFTVSSDREIFDSFSLTLRYETPLPEDAASFSVPKIAVLDTIRSTGNIAITAIGNIEINSGMDNEKIRRIDVTELPGTLRRIATSSILFAFHYNASGYRLGFETRKLEDVAVQVAVIDEAQITTLITNQGICTTLAQFAVRNNERQFLRVSLRDGAEVLGARVAGRAVKPSRDGDTQAVLLPLRKSGPNGTAFLVELVYTEHFPEPDAGRLKLALEAPATDMKIDEFYWDVRIPESSRLLNIDTDLEGIKSYADQPRPVTQETIGVKRETVYRLRESIERFMITDINNPGASAQSRSRGYSGRPRTPLAQSEHDPSIAAVAGVIPLNVSLPRGGTVYSFRQLYVAKGTAITMAIDMREKDVWIRLGALFGGVGVLLGVFACLVIHGRWKSRMNVAATALLLFLLLYMASNWQAVPFSLLGVALGAVFALAIAPLKRVFSRLARPKETSSLLKPPTSPQS